MYKRKTKAVFFANRTAKIRTLFIILQNFLEVFLFFSLSAISLFHYVNSARLSSLGKRVQKYALLVYNPNILNYFFEVFLKESAKTLKDNDVVEHIFYHEWIGGGNGKSGGRKQGGHGGFQKAVSHFFSPELSVSSLKFSNGFLFLKR